MSVAAIAGDGGGKISFVSDPTGASSFIAGTGASGTIATYTVGATIPICASVRLTNCVMPTGAVVVAVKKNGTTQFSLTISSASIGSTSGFNLTVPPVDVADEPKGLLTCTAGDVITFVVTSGTMPGSTTLTALLYSAAPSSPLADGAQRYWRSHPTCGPLAALGWPASAPQRIVTAFGVAGTAQFSCDNPGQIVNDGSGNLWVMSAFQEYDWQHNLAPTDVQKESIYAYSLPATPSGTAYHSVVAGYSPLGYWRMNDTSGTVMVATNGNNGTYQNVTLNQPGIADGNAVKFTTASSSGAQVAIDLSGQTRIIIALLVNWNNGGNYANDDQLLCEYTANYNSNAGGFIIDPNDSTSSKFNIAMDVAGTRNSAQFARPANGPHCLVFDLNRNQAAALQIIPYVDGVPVAYTKTNNNAAISNFANSNLNLMCRNLASLFATGTLQHVAIFGGTTLSAQQVANDLSIAAGLGTRQVWDAKGLVLTQQAGADPVTGLTDQTYAVSSPHLTTDLSGNALLLVLTTDGDGTGGEQNFTRSSLKCISASTIPGLIGFAGNPVTLYSRLRSNTPELAPGDFGIFPRAATNDYLLLITRSYNYDNQHVVAIVVSSLTSLIITDTIWANAPVVIFNNNQGGTGFVRNGIVYWAAWQIPGQNNTQETQVVYSAPLASATDPTQWTVVSHGRTWMAALSGDKYQDGGISGDCQHPSYYAGSDTLYSVVPVWSVANTVMSLLWYEVVFNSLFTNGPLTLFANSSVDDFKPGAAPLLDWPLATTSAWSVTFTPTQIVGTTYNFGIMLGKDPPANPEPRPLQFGLFLTATTWTLTWYDASHVATDVASGSTSALVLNTPVTLKLSMTPTLTFQASINGSNVGSPYTVTSGGTSSALVASLSGASATWKGWATNGNACTIAASGAALTQ